MSYQPSKKAVFSLTIPTVVLIILASLSGILNGEEIYSAETANWRAQAISQDYIDLILLVPHLIISLFFASRGNIKAVMLWAGGMVYTLYTFTIYCYAINFNSLFLVYCAVLGISFYSLLLFLLSYNIYSQKLNIKKNTPITGIFLIIIAIVFSLLWLSEIITAVINGEKPEQLVETGLMVNPIHVNDLSVLLPAFLMTGIFLLKRKSTGLIFTPVLLSFSVLMNITIATLVVLMNNYQVETSYTVAFIMLALTLISLILLISYLRNMEIKTA
ncbi:MAG: hypothetical protein Kow0098_05080 [Ignavibacteriaceae bacterium]